MKERASLLGTLRLMLEVLTSTTKEAPLEGYVGQQYVGIDLHRKRSVIVRTDTDGGLLESVQIINTADGLERVIALGSNLRHRVVRTER